MTPAMALRLTTTPDLISNIFVQSKITEITFIKMTKVKNACSGIAKSAVCAPSPTTSMNNAVLVIQNVGCSEVIYRVFFREEENCTNTHFSECKIPVK